MKRISVFVHAVPMLVVAVCAYVYAQGGTGRDIGIGARAFAFAGNHTAVVNDLSAVYWNPAALAFLPVREFQASFDVARTIGNSKISGGGVSELPGANMDDIMDRLRLRGIGAMTAIPTVQGGLTLAASYESPFAFDDFSLYGFIDKDGETVSDDYRRYGDINRWNMAFGVQVAPQIAAGLTVSIVTGNDAQTSTTVDYTDKQEWKYWGYALTGGLMYRPTDYLNVGLNINMTMDLDVKWTGSTVWADDDVPNKSKESGSAYRAPYGALGFGLTLPWLIAALDLRFVMPYTFILPGVNIPNGAQSRDFKAGAGIGLEVPMPASAPIVLRAGYSVDQCDFYTFVQGFKNEVGNEEIDWWYEDYWSKFSPIGLKHSFSLGWAIFTSGTGFELSYGYQTWGLKKNDGYTLSQTYSNHRVMGAIIFRY